MEYIIGKKIWTIFSKFCIFPNKISPLEVFERHLDFRNFINVFDTKRPFILNLVRPHHNIDHSKLDWPEEPVSYTVDYFTSYDAMACTAMLITFTTFNIS